MSATQSFGIRVTECDQSYSSFEGWHVTRSSTTYSPYASRAAAAAEMRSMRRYYAKHETGDKTDPRSDALWYEIKIVPLQTWRQSRRAEEKRAYNELANGTKKETKLLLSLVAVREQARPLTETEFFELALRGLAAISKRGKHYLTPDGETLYRRIARYGIEGVIESWFDRESGPLPWDEKLRTAATTTARR